MPDVIVACGIGGWLGPKPGDPDNSSILSAVPAFGGIDVSWTFPGLNPYAVAHFILYRSTAPLVVGAMQRTIQHGNFFYDRLDTGTVYYYWIQIISTNGTPGEIIGPASAMAQPLIADLIELLTGQINRGVLATALRADIEQISLINDNLLGEIFDRETGETSLAQAIQDAENGVAEAHTFIATEIATRINADEVIVEKIDLVAASFEDDYGAVIQTMSVDIDALNDTVDAMYMVKVDVNGYVGGFGIHNDGDQIQAVFDVDLFAIGKSQAGVGPKIYPFIVSGSSVYIKEAAIEKLTFSKLRDESGNFIVEDGKVKANYLRVIEVMSGNFTGNAWPAPGGTGFYLGPGAFLMGNYNDGRYVQISAAGDIYMPGFSIVNGLMTISAINVIGNAQLQNAAITNAKIGNAEVGTLSIAGNAVTAMHFVGGGSLGSGLAATNALTLYIDMGPGGGGVVLQGVISGFHPESGLLYGRIIRARDGAVLSSGTLGPVAGVGAGGATGQIVLLACDDAPVAGSNAYHLQVESGQGVINTQITATGGKR